MRRTQNDHAAYTRCITFTHQFASAMRATDHASKSLLRAHWRPVPLNLITNYRNYWRARCAGMADCYGNDRTIRQAARGTVRDPTTLCHPFPLPAPLV